MKMFMILIAMMAMLFYSPSFGSAHAAESDIYCNLPTTSPAWRPCAGISSYHLISAASDNATEVSTGGHVLYHIFAGNTNTTVYYLKFYDTATTPTCGTTPVLLTYPIPYGASNSGGGFVINIPFGAQFVNGIGVCIVSGIADNSDGSAATGIAVDLVYH